MSLAFPSRVQEEAGIENEWMDGFGGFWLHVTSFAGRGQQLTALQTERGEPKKRHNFHPERFPFVLLSPRVSRLVGGSLVMFSKAKGSVTRPVALRGWLQQPAG